ncbi:hypothetical protein [Mesorhizobium sp. IMUNJ 23232]|uniref:hypothetical protein n=1 Tax=Mesorhizobium sp. IMUNJ 23232 TaxID=3376064 RepID=UPI0037B4C942
MKTAARRLERAIVDICRVEAAKESPPINGLVLHLLRTPLVAGVSLGTTLTNLSAFARIRCFESLAAKPDDWLAGDKDATIAHRRRLILAAGGHDRLIARFTNLLEKHQDSLRVSPVTL